MARKKHKRSTSAPEAAIQAFEDWSGLRVSYHDTEYRLRPFLPSFRHAHQHPFCLSLRNTPNYNSACCRFELAGVRKWLLRNPDGCSKICHAGIVEWAAPILHAGQISAVLFAGLRLRGRGLKVDLKDDCATRAQSLWPADVPKPERVTQKQSELYLEGLRQLAARLQLWLEAHERFMAVSGAGGGIDSVVDARHMIEEYIAQYYREPIKLVDLAKVMTLSRSRTAHLVKEVCGQTFVTMLQQHRLRHAADLLRRTSDSVNKVAVASGFNDISHFYKAFRSHYRITPYQYRKHGKM